MNIGLKKLHASHILAISFIVLISIGTLLLAMPFSSRNNDVSILDAAFTATSAACVTGLVVVDTGTQWTVWGQLVILFLIQIGGLGIMTFSTFIAYIIGRRLGIINRNLLEHSVGLGHGATLGRLLFVIIGGTLLIEFFGAIVLIWRFSYHYTFSESIYLGIFHSISAFCNAGFSLFSSNLIAFQNDVTINLTIIILIILGGLGFLVLFDLKKFSFRNLKLHSKIVVSATFFLITVGFLLFLFLEWNNSLANFSFIHKLIAALFQSVTSRTAGFNTVPIESLTNSSLFLLMILMMIGASPGSCGGGMKTTTFAVVLALIFSRLRDQRQVHIFKRGIPEHVISKAIGIAFFLLSMVTVACMFLLITEHPGGLHSEGRVVFIEVLFECFSAIGTVGLSMGLTPVLSTIGKMIIILLMYVGRVGPVTLALAIAVKKSPRLRLAEEEFWVG